MKRGSSLRFMATPIACFSDSLWIEVLIAVSLRRDRFGLRRGCRGRRGRELRGGLLHGFDDVLIAGAAAEVARQRVADRGFVGVGGVLEQDGGRHEHPRRAEAALETVAVPERLLQRVQLRALR